MRTAFPRVARILLSAAPVRLAVSIILDTALALSWVAYPYLLKVAIDAVLRSDNRVALLCAVGIGGVTAAQTLGWRVSWFVSSQLGERIDRAFSEELMRTSMNVPGLEPFELPDFIDRMELTQQAGRTIVLGVPTLLRHLALLVQFVATMGLLGRIDPRLLILPAFALPSILAVRRAHRWNQRRYEQLVQRLRLESHLFELVTTSGPAKDVRMDGSGQEIARRGRLLYDEITAHQVRGMVRSDALRLAADSFFGIGYLAAVALVAFKAVHGDATPGDVGLAIVLIGRVSAQVTELLAAGSQALDIGRSVARFAWLLERATGSRTSGVAPPATISAGIRLDGVGYRYPGSARQALAGVDVDIPAGSVVALVGENGAGKSTLVKLLCRFYVPDGGSITLDGTDISTYDNAAWRAAITATFQDHADVKFTIREAVGIGDLDAGFDDVRIREALDRVAAGELLDRLASGLDTQLGREFGGTELSGGQWQKVAIARAMMRQSPLVTVLDEPTSALDPASEQALFEQYATTARRAAAANGGITVLVSHHFSTVRMADLILVLEGGHVVERGSHEELVAIGGRYAAMHELQAAAYR